MPGPGRTIFNVIAELDGLILTTLYDVWLVSLQQCNIPYIFTYAFHVTATSNYSCQIDLIV